MPQKVCEAVEGQGDKYRKEVNITERASDAEQTPDVVRRLEITAELDRQATEALCLEIRRLAGRYGVEIREFRVEKVTGETCGPGDGESSGAELFS